MFGRFLDLTCCIEYYTIALSLSSHSIYCTTRKMQMVLMIIKHDQQYIYQMCISHTTLVCSRYLRNVRHKSYSLRLNVVHTNRMLC